MHCFVLLALFYLLSISHAVGVHQWHTMEGCGEDNVIKLINEVTHIDVLLDRNIKEFNVRKEQEILIHVRTVGLQGLAFRGH